MLKRSGLVLAALVGAIVLTACEHEEATVESPESNDSGSDSGSSPSSDSTLNQTVVTWTGSGTVSARTLPRPTDTESGIASIDLGDNSIAGLLKATVTPTVPDAPLRFEVRTGAQYGIAGLNSAKCSFDSETSSILNYASVGTCVIRAIRPETSTTTQGEADATFTVLPRPAYGFYCQQAYVPESDIDSPYLPAVLDKLDNDSALSMLVTCWADPSRNSRGQVVEDPTLSEADKRAVQSALLSTFGGLEDELISGPCNIGKSQSDVRNSYTRLGRPSVDSELYTVGRILRVFKKRESEIATPCVFEVRLRDSGAWPWYSGQAQRFRIITDDQYRKNPDEIQMSGDGSCVTLAGVATACGGYTGSGIATVTVTAPSPFISAGSPVQMAASLKVPISGAVISGSPTWSVLSGLCTVSPTGVVTGTGSGECTVKATYPETADYAQSAGSATFTVVRGMLSVGVTAVDSNGVVIAPTVPAGQATGMRVTVTDPKTGAEVSMSAQPTWSASPPGWCSVTSSGQFTGYADLTCTVTATFPKTEKYEAATGSIAIVVTPLPQTVTWNPETSPGLTPSNQGGNQFTASRAATSTGSGAITYSVSNPGKTSCRIGSQSPLTILVGANGTCAVTATAAATTPAEPKDGVYAAASTTVAFTISGFITEPSTSTEGGGAGGDDRGTYDCPEGSRAVWNGLRWFCELI
jgi:hypothetical protein